MTTRLSVSNVVVVVVNICEKEMISNKRNTLGYKVCVIVYTLGNL